MSTPRHMWGDGPWQHEPDEYSWIDEQTQYPCLVTRGPFGAWCGYVGITPNHPAYELSYNGYPDENEKEYRKHYHDAMIKAIEDLPARPVIDPGSIGEKIISIEVHGGLTFAGHMRSIPKYWWFGFNCSHAWDFAPGQPLFRRTTGTVYRDFDFVKKQCTALAAQLKALDSSLKE